MILVPIDERWGDLLVRHGVLREHQCDDRSAIALATARVIDVIIAQDGIDSVSGGE